MMYPSSVNRNNKINRGIKYLHIKYEIFEKKSDTFLLKKVDF